MQGELQIFFQGESRIISKICEKFKFYNFVINLTCDTPSNGSDYLWQILKKKWFRTENVAERTRFSKSRSNVLEDIGQGLRSSHATHPLMLMIICTKYGKNPSRTVDATERTRFSRPRPNDLEDIGQGVRSLYATHPLILVIICAKYGKNPSRTVDIFHQGQGQKISKICQKLKFPESKLTYHATHPLMIVIICARYKKNPSRTLDATERSRFSKSRPNDLEDIGQGQRSSHATHPLMLLIICTKYGNNPSWTVDVTRGTWKVNGQTDKQTDGQTGWIQYTPLWPICNQEGFLSLTDICQTSTGINTRISISFLLKQWDVINHACRESNVEVKASIMDCQKVIPLHCA